jgi:basic membrane protein A
MSLISHSKKRAIARGTLVGAVIVIIVVAALGTYYYTTLTTKSSSKVTIGIVYDTGGKGDKSFNDMAYAGVLQANSSLGINYIEESSTDASDYVPNIEALVSKNVSLIVCVGFLMDDAVASEAAKYPNMKFAQIDGDDYNITNVVAIKYQENLGSALVGALAVAMTKTDVIGFIGGMSTGIIYKFWHGYQYGVSWAESYLGKTVTLLPAQYTGTTGAAWDDPTTDSQIAQSMMAKGADIIYAAAGASGVGMFNAVGAADKATGWNWSLTTPPKYFAIGVDSDQDYYGTYQYFVQGQSTGFTAPSFVLTSEMKRVDTGVYTVIESVVAGNYSSFWNNPTKWGPTFFNGTTQICGSTGDQPCYVRGVFLLGLAQGGVGPSPMTYTQQYLTPQATTVMAQLKAAILNGTANVPENYNP